MRDEDVYFGVMGIKKAESIGLLITASPGFASAIICWDSASITSLFSQEVPSYVPGLEAAGYKLTIREPDWHQHRLFKGPDTNINLHVFTVGSREIDRVLLL